MAIHHVHYADDPEVCIESCDEQDEGYVTCQGCGAIRGMSWFNKPHSCYRNADGTYEEGGTFQ